MSIYVGNLSYQVTEEDLKRAFAEYGTVSRVQLPTDRETGRPRGFAFVEMEKETEEAAAIEALDGAEWMGRDLRVNKAKPREDRGSSRGGGGGSWSNRGGGGDRSGGSGGGGRRY
ncbi:MULTISPECIES: RNA-binding protein [unclassified Anabaena]|jgi:RNA recognition motif-containing protein|uniref:RNA recognition motif domain-containing protein n=1 Tax=unclassified Anabaena TaxID=2619674 RepID=UPI001446AEF7|nr:MULTISPECIES: RNA-binding protein [unclassified Anabaena]MTJ06569.1 RNA-binding protein [Anabaena sp. UHCC 0204]MTJ54338.1 RNA-binding protein [Anabaena sp. UHCC 0253]